MEDNIRLAGIDAKHEAIAKESAVLKAEVDTIKSDVGEVRREVSKISGGIGTATWIAALLLVVLVGLVAAFGKAFVRDTAREVVQEVVKTEMRDRRSVVQDGAFNAANQVTGMPGVFEWTLRDPVDPSGLIDIRAEILGPVPGAMVKAELADSGKKCRMTVLPPGTSLPDTVKARVYITVAAR